ncbi:uncharacterized protein LOC113324878 [Papaver somniferum]|uniref:uncharacterized protein LOC113324878 n=1 Tax=Papaver somniferum TaxID=3469 RepID=UPI000E6FD1F3|nr:uncharacterized protein LOC113324878 [Papaver somniferum]
MKPLMDKIISPTQAAYVRRRYINDNIVMAHELIHSMKKSKNKHGLVALKLDMSKAFDRVEWAFIDKMLSSFGFSKDWRTIIYQCISITIVLIRLNGSIFQSYTPTRGLRQGDPLSPYLFIISIEYLVISLMHAEARNLLRGIQVVKNSISANHLLFADDCILFFHADYSSINQVQSCLQNFSNISGQLINFSKSSAFVTSDLSDDAKRDIKNKLRFKQLSSSDKYLGLPILLGKSKTSSFRPIQDSYENRFQGWCSKTLNQAAKTTLVNSFLNSIPSHYMNEGSLAFRNLEKFNISLITKLAWRLCTEEDKPWTQIMKAKYSPYSNFLHLQESPYNSSWIWKGLEMGLYYVRKFHRWDVRDGTKFLVWWNTQLVFDLFPADAAKLILRMHLVQVGTDKLIWEPSRTSEFSVKTTYKALTNLSNGAHQRSLDGLNVNWRKLWKSNAHHKAEETIQHLLIQCDYSRSVWLFMNVNVSLLQNQGTDVVDWIASWFQASTKPSKEEWNHWILTLMITAWFLWKNRCLKKFENKNQNLFLTVHSIKNMVNQCLLGSSMINQKVLQSWSPPPPYEFKINMDASFDYSTSNFGIGMITRDSTGQCCAIRGRFFNGGINPEQAECVSMKEAILWARE